jgi:hypothetical protein
MTPIIADGTFAGVTEALAMYTCWVIAVALSFGSLILACAKRTRVVSSWLAVGCMIVWPMVPVAFISLALELHSHGKPLLSEGDSVWTAVIGACAPILVALAVYSFDKRRLKRNREARHAA